MRYRTFLLLTATCLLAGAARTTYAQTFLDAGMVQIGGGGLVQTAATFAAPDGSFYVAGGFTGEVILGGVSFTASDDADPFVAKYDAGGTLVWARRAAGLSLATDGASLDGATSLAVDDDGNVYVGGAFAGGLDFVDGAGATVAHLAQADGAGVVSFEAFVAKYGPDGTLLWAVGGGGGTRTADERMDVFGVDKVAAVQVDAFGDVFVAGAFSGNAFLGLAFQDPAVTVTARACPIVARLDPADGSVVWMSAGLPDTPVTADGDLWGGGFTTMAAGGATLYVLGEYTGSLQFGYLQWPGQPTESTFLAPFDQVSHVGVSIVQLDPETGLNFITGYLYSDTGSFAVHDIASDASDNLYLVGYFEEAGADADGARDGLVAKFDADLGDLWQILFDSVGPMASASVTGIRVDDAGIPYLTGAYSGVLVFGGAGDGDEVRTLSAGVAQRASFVAMLTTAGTPQWVRNVTSTSGEVGTNLVGTASNGLVSGGATPVQFTLHDNAAPDAADQIRLTSTFSGTLGLTSGAQTAASYDAFSGQLVLPLVTLYEEWFGVEAGFNYYMFDGIDDESYVGLFDEGPDDIAMLTMTVAPNTAPPDMPAGAKAVKRYFHVTANAWDGSVATGFDADVNLCYTEAELIAGGIDPANEDRLELYRYDGVAWQRVGGTADPSTHCVYVDGVAAFSDWAVADPFDNPLPVELVSFTGTYGNGAVTLTWQTASETNNAGFEVQRAAGLDTSFVRVDFVEGGGRVVEPRRYQYTDRAAPAAPLRYRLRQVDYDGAFVYSPVVEVDPGLPAAFALEPNFPNPFNPSTVIRFALPRAADVELSVYDVLGRRVARLVEAPMPAGRHEVRFDASVLPSGTYLYRLQAGTYVQARTMLLVR